MLEELENSLKEMMKCLSEEGVPENALLKRKLLLLTDELELYLHEGDDDFERPLLSDWFVEGVLKVIRLFFYGWLNGIFAEDQELRMYTFRVLAKLHSCTFNEVQDENLFVVLGQSIADLQNLINDVFDRRRKEGVQ